MEFKIPTTELMRMIQLSISVTEKRTTVPVLSNILLRTKDKALHVAVTDLEVFFTGTLPCEVKDDGDITVSVKQIHDIIRELPSDIDLHFRTKENHWVELICGKAKFDLMGLPAKDFPAVPEIESLQFSEVDTDTLLEMIEKTQFSVSNDETRYHLNGVYLTRREGQAAKTLRMVSTDGHRLSLIDRTMTADLTQIGKGIIIPKKGLNEIRKILTDVDGSLLIAIDENRIVIRRGSIALQIRLIEGEFPDYQRVIPKNNDKMLRVSRELFLSSLKRVSLMCNDQSRTVTLAIRPGSMEVKSNNPNVGEAKEELEIDYQGTAMNIGFNARYFIDVLSSINTSDVQISLKDELSPGVIKSPTDESYTAVVMPMRI